ncbi:phage tail protein [Moorena sp. SIO3F7]|uniref:phage tail protein n=2 Tax=unclassified Moorena TaxID=2683338 RepID=UPI0025D370D5|nr:phage tail protein [Moorena sp. SIO3F7]
MMASLSSLPLGANAAYAGVTGALGARLDPYQGFNFLIEIEGLVTGGFIEVRGLESEIEVEERPEGGQNRYVHQLLGRTKYPNLTLKHGLTGIDSLWTWYQATSKGVIRRKNGTIMLLDRQQIPAMYWNFKQALPVKWTGPEFNASSNEIAFETIELIHKGISKPVLSQALSGGRAIAGLAGAL